MGLDIKNYYLGTPLDRYEYMRFKLTDIPDEIRRQYNLDALAVDGWVYVEIRKGMYGLPQVGILANKLLKNASDNMATTNVSAHRVYGDTPGARLCSF